MRYQILAYIMCLVIAGSGCGDSATVPTVPTPPGQTPAVAPTPVPRPPPKPPDYPSIAVGQVIRFHFTDDDRPCVGAGGRCRSYNITAPSDGTLIAVLASVSGTDTFISTTEMYIVPGGDYWDIGPGPQISVTVSVKAGTTYEIRMYSATVPSEELELRTSLQ